MKRIRYPLALVCLILAAYCFLRNPTPLWTQETPSLLALGFSADSQYLWTYYRDNNSKPHPVLVLQRHEKNTGKVVQEHQVILKSPEEEHVDLSQNLKLAYIHIHPVQRWYRFNPEELLLDLTTGEIQAPNNNGKKRYSLSPTGQWLLRIEETGGVSICDRAGKQLLFTLKPEIEEGVNYCHPSYTPQFNPDETRMATAWYRLDAKGNYIDCEIRLYDTSTWKELSRIKIGDNISCDLSSLTHDQLLYVCNHPNAAGAGQHDFLYYTMKFSDSLMNHEPPRLIYSGSHRNSAAPNYCREYQIILEQGTDWHAVRCVRESYQYPWIESLRNRKFLSMMINALWPRKTTTLELFQTSTGTLMGRVPIQADTNYRISPDGQWVAGNVSTPGLFAVCSTQPLTRWPGYVLGLAGIAVFFWRTKKSRVAAASGATETAHESTP